ncbi:N6-adenosine-methyltransferase catalytic subunit-like [Saccostrea echinata]|uniref:N6-adenosine-methyltransferase catalytic subunit-like n=1 Tax=Saccostrea echinata TaxID=191078 RepID=UPI002A813E40|nr:N6-adenosine-methyltransferase catalytic subunit-like [Saccostrea echinata]
MSLSSMRARMLQRKKEREGLEAEISKSSQSSVTDGTKKDSNPDLVISHTSSVSVPKAAQVLSKPDVPQKEAQEPIKSDPEVEKKVLMVLCDINLDIPCNAAVIADHTKKALGRGVTLATIEGLLQNFASRQLISITTEESPSSGNSKYIVQDLDLTKLLAVIKNPQSKKRKREEDDDDIGKKRPQKQSKQQSTDAGIDDIESLLSMQSAKERVSKQVNEEIQQLLAHPTAKEQILVKRFKSQGGVQVQEFCQYGTKEECQRLKESKEKCDRLHFRKIIHKHTDESLGDCSFLNTCFHMDTCKYVHYEIDYPARNEMEGMKKELMMAKSVLDQSNDGDVHMFPPQWIQCDLRHFDMSTLGKCAVVMADPPWDIHMELPYGTMQDDEMRKLDVPVLQDDGFIFLWVTGRAMELGRECLDLWGYKRIDELIWVKTNQLQRIIRTGRTGHWLNHGKEHCLVGVKGNPKGANRGLDCDVLVAEVRATSHKPDEVYGIIERLSPGTRKVELFGRPHNVQPNWITLGNQLEGVRLKDPDIVSRFKEKYPDGNCMEPAKPKT